MRFAPFVVLVLVVASAAGCREPSGPYIPRADPMMARMCGDPRAAYEAGYNGGMSRQPMSSAWVDGCAPQGREGQRQAYVAGYQAGVQVAPQYAAYPQPAYAPAFGVVVGGYGYAHPVAAARPAPKCELNADGTHTCGYNCEFGADGNHYCSSTPEGKCAFEAGGTYACP